MKQHPLWILFLVLIFAMLLGGLALFVLGAMHPQPLLRPLLG